MAIKLGMEAALKYKVGAGAWTELKNVKDVTLNLEAGEADRAPVDGAWQGSSGSYAKGANASSRTVGRLDGSVEDGHMDQCLCGHDGHSNRRGAGVGRQRRRAQEEKTWRGAGSRGGRKSKGPPRESRRLSCGGPGTQEVQESPIDRRLFHQPTRLADGFELEDALSAALREIHPKSWFPRTPPKRDFGSSANSERT